MLANSMTLRDQRGAEVTIPVGPLDAARVNGDCVLGGNVAINAPAWVEILLHADGTWEHWITRWQDKGNTYLHIQHEFMYPQGQPAATEQQRRAVARWWLGIDAKPYGMSLGQSVCEWAFAGMTPDQISAQYGSKVYLNIPGGEEESPEPEDRTPYHKGDNDA
jgi:hypothetical protein